MLQPDLPSCVCAVGASCTKHQDRNALASVYSSVYEPGNWPTASSARLCAVQCEDHSACSLYVWISPAAASGDGGPEDVDPQWAQRHGLIRYCAHSLPPCASTPSSPLHPRHTHNHTQTRPRPHTLMGADVFFGPSPSSTHGGKMRSLQTRGRSSAALCQADAHFLSHAAKWARCAQMAACVQAQMRVHARLRGVAARTAPVPVKGEWGAPCHAPLVWTAKTERCQFMAGTQ